MSLIWSPKQQSVHDSNLLERVGSMVDLAILPLDPCLFEMLEKISVKLLKDSLSLNISRYTSLGYWLRRASLQRIGQQLASGSSENLLRAPRGLALHLPPTNVDTMMVYSWAISVLAGNANIVRIPTKFSSETEYLIETVSSIVEECDQSSRNLFAHYPYGGELESALSCLCDVRLIWGGDAKVAAVSRTPIRVGGINIGFPDRTSFSIIDSAAYHKSSIDARIRLAENFSNDIYWFNQMGCGSPKLLIWVGDSKELQCDFYERVGHAATAKGYQVSPFASIEKFALANTLLSRGASTGYQRFSCVFDVCRLIDPERKLNYDPGSGFLYVWTASSISEIARVLNRKTQTISYYGLPPESMDSLVSLVCARGGHRIVPIGSALQFDAVWEGIDLLSCLTRIVSSS